VEKLIKAVVKAKGEFPEIGKGASVNIKTKTGRTISYSYATLPSIHKAITPALTTNGLFVSDSVEEAGLYVRLWHESGECLVSGPYPLPDTRDEKAFGIAMTYGRRYLLTGLLGIAPDDDVDAPNVDADTPSRKNNTMPAKPAAKPAKKQSPLADDVKETISDAVANGLTVDEIRALCKANNLPASSDKFTDKSQLTALNAVLQDEIAQRNQFEPAGPDIGDGENIPFT